jgi:hypothetical protein
MNLQENVNRIKQVMGVLNEQTKIKEIPVEDEIFKKRYDPVIRPLLNKAKEYYIKYYSDKKNTSKLKYKDNIDIIKQFIPTIDYKPYYEYNDKTLGFVAHDYPTVMYLNIYYLFTQEKFDFTPKTEMLFNTIFHETAHLIDLRLRSLHEKTIMSTYNIFNVKDDDDEYTENDMETYARVQTLRTKLGISPTANGTQIKNKILGAIKQGKITFPDVKVKSKGNILQFIKKGFTGQAINDIFNTQDLKSLRDFYSTIRFNGNYTDDIYYLFAKFSTIDNNSVFLDLDRLGYVNISVVDNTKKTTNNTQAT